MTSPSLGLENVLYTLAQCCNPIPGDEIVGYTTRGGKGVTVHRAECPVLARTDSRRHLQAAWKGNQSQRRPVRIQVISDDEPGLLAEITNVLRQAEVNIVKANVETTLDQKGISWFTIEVTNRDHLAKTISQLKRLKSVINVHRLMG